MRRGFTLVEMLILLSLTALLISLIMPALSRSREFSFGMECMSNLKQLGTLHQANPFDREKWGSSAYDLSGTNGSPDDNPRDQGFGVGDDDPTFVRPKIRYRGNIDFDERMEWQAMGQPSNWTLNCPVAERSEINSYGINFEMRYRPFEVVLNREVIFGDSSYKVVDVPKNYDLRHLGQGNFSFADTHVEMTSLENIFTDSQLGRVSFRQPPINGG